MDKGKAPEPVKIKEGLYLVGSSNALSLTAVKLAELRGEETYMRLSSCIEPLRGEYDYIFIDCTPSLCTLTLNALAAADETLIPVTPDILSVNGINKLFDVSNRIRDTYNGRLSSSGILFTRYDRRKTLHKTLREGMIRRFGPAVYDTVIRENVSIAEAPLKHSDVLAYAGRSNGAEDYRDLALEFLKRHNYKLHNPSIKVK
jgi:chromosome partitioning protein